MNARMVEAALGMLARMMPPEQWAIVHRDLSELVAYAKSADARLAKLEAIAERLEFLETIVRNNVDGAGAAFAERAMYMVPGTIEKALAPAEPGVLNGGRNQSG